MRPYPGQIYPGQTYPILRQDHYATFSGSAPVAIPIDLGPWLGGGDWVRAFQLHAVMILDDEGALYGSAIVPITVRIAGGSITHVTIGEGGSTGSTGVTQRYVHIIGDLQQTAGSEAAPSWGASITGATEITVTFSGANVTSGRIHVRPGPWVELP